jgi:hypothetical protein
MLVLALSGVLSSKRQSYRLAWCIYPLDPEEKLYNAIILDSKARPWNQGLLYGIRSDK